MPVTKPKPAKQAFQTRPERVNYSPRVYPEPAYDYRVYVSPVTVLWWLVRVLIPLAVLAYIWSQTENTYVFAAAAFLFVLGGLYGALFRC